MTEMTFDEKVDYNIARLLNESKAGNGLLAKQFASSYDEVRNDTLQNHRLRQSRNPNLGDLSDEELTRQVNATMDAKAENELAPALKKASRGASAQVDLQQFGGMAAAGSAVMSGGIMGKILGLSSLLSFAPAMDFFKGVISWLSGNGFERGMQESKFDRGIGELAEKLRVDSDQLKKELLAEPAAPAAAPMTQADASQAAAAGQQAAAGAMPPGVQGDKGFNASNIPNGVLPDGGPGATPKGQARTAVRKPGGAPAAPAIQ